MASPPGSAKRWPLRMTVPVLRCVFSGASPVHALPEYTGRGVQVVQVISRTTARIRVTCGGTRWVAENFTKSGAASPRGLGKRSLEGPGFLSAPARLSWSNRPPLSCLVSLCPSPLGCVARSIIVRAAALAKGWPPDGQRCASRGRAAPGWLPVPKRRYTLRPSAWRAVVPAWPDASG